MLEGGRYALLHTRSLEFDDLDRMCPVTTSATSIGRRPARSGQVLIKRFVTEMHHKILRGGRCGPQHHRARRIW